MPWDFVVFYLIAAVCIADRRSAWWRRRNPVHSGIFLVLCFLMWRASS